MKSRYGGHATDHKYLRWLLLYDAKFSDADWRRRGIDSGAWWYGTWRQRLAPIMTDRRGFQVTSIAADNTHDRLKCSKLKHATSLDPRTLRGM